MTRPPNHADARRLLAPRDYLEDPWAYGRAPSRLVIPDDGDPVSALVAQVQHQLVMHWRAQGSGSASAVGRRVGVSTSTMSRCVLGERWLGETVMAAMLDDMGLLDLHRLR